MDLRDRIRLFLFKGNVINRQIAGIMIASIAATIMLCWGVTTFFLADFYIDRTHDKMVDTYYSINQTCEAGFLYLDSYKDEFDRMCANSGMSVVVAKANGNVMISSAGYSSALVQQLQYVMLDSTIGPNDKRVLENCDSYSVVEIHDTRLDEEYLILYGTLYDGNLIMIRQAIEGIRQTAALSNQFLLYTSIVGLIIGIILANFMSTRFTKPIIELTRISRKMNNLDFEAKYVPQAHRNEIDDLGEKLNEMSETLENTISQLQYANDELIKDIKLKEETEELRKDFISSVSHELKTPIALIQGYAEGLSEGIMDDEESRQFYLDVIIDEANRMNRLVRELLTLNQLESGFNDGPMETFDIIEVIGGVIESNKLLFEQNNITVSYPMDEILLVNGEEFYIEQVVSNYMSNAIHHIEGDRYITVNYFKKEKNVRISVFNTGKCIPEGDIEHVWDKFYKVDKARTREYGGSGIGLSVVKAIMDRHNQSYGVKNHSDGVEFFFELEMASEEKFNEI